MSRLGHPLGSASRSWHIDVDRVQVRCRIRLSVLYLCFQKVHRTSEMKTSNVMQSQIGRGEQTYARAKELLDSWRQLELEWSTCALPGIQDGTVQTKVSRFVGYIATALARLT